MIETIDNPLFLFVDDLEIQDCITNFNNHIYINQVRCLIFLSFCYFKDNYLNE